MSHTNSTPNYGLPEFLSTDKPAWMADMNTAFSAIDTQMKLNADAAAGAQSTADDAQHNFAQGYSNVSTYAVGDVVVYQDRLYKCDIAVTTPENWDNTKWSLYRLADLKTAEEAVEAKLGNTSISGIGDGTVTGAIDAINTDITVKNISSQVTLSATVVDTLYTKSAYELNGLKDINVAFKTAITIGANVSVPIATCPAFSVPSHVQVYSKYGANVMAFVANGEINLFATAAITAGDTLYFTIVGF